MLQFEHYPELPAETATHRAVLGDTDEGSGGPYKGGTAQPCQNHSKGEDGSYGEQRPTNPTDAGELLYGW